MLKMLSGVALVFAACLPVVAEEATTGEIADLCAKNIEGSAIGTVGKSRNVRMNFFCLDSNRVAASAFIEGLPNVTLTFAGVSKGVLVLSQFPLDADGRKGVSATTSMTYVKLNLEALKQGVVSGYFMNGNLTFPLPIAGKTVQVFPSTAKLESKQVTEHRDFIGVYSMQLADGAQGGGGKVSNVDLWVDINNNIPLFNMKVRIPLAGAQDTLDTHGTQAAGSAIHFVDGSVWDQKTGFEATTSFGDTSTTGVPLWHLRGRVLGNGILEIYLIDPINGLRGPIIAKKRGDPWSYLHMGPKPVEDASLKH